MYLPRIILIPAASHPAIIADIMNQPQPMLPIPRMYRK
jgi:hypothetical protein